MIFEENNMYELVYFDSAREFIIGLPEDVGSKIAMALEVMQEGKIQLIHTKKLHGKIRELIIKNCRILFFIETKKIYLTNGFIKKTNKTPVKEIEYAEKIYKIITK